MRDGVVFVFDVFVVARSATCFHTRKRRFLSTDAAAIASTIVVCVDSESRHRTAGGGGVKDSKLLMPLCSFCARLRSHQSSRIAAFRCELLQQVLSHRYRQGRAFGLSWGFLDELWMGSGMMGSGCSSQALTAGGFMSCCGKWSQEVVHMDLRRLCEFGSGHNLSMKSCYESQHLSSSFC